MNFELIKKLGPCGAAGVLLGLLGVWWIAPTTGAGAALLILIAVAVAYVACGVAGFLRKRAAHPDDDARDPADP